MDRCFGLNLDFMILRSCNFWSQGDENFHLAATWTTHFHAFYAWPRGEMLSFSPRGAVMDGGPTSSNVEQICQILFFCCCCLFFCCFKSQIIRLWQCYPVRDVSFSVSDAWQLRVLEVLAGAWSATLPQTRTPTPAGVCLTTEKLIYLSSLNPARLVQVTNRA